MELQKRRKFFCSEAVFVVKLLGGELLA